MPDGPSILSYSANEKGRVAPSRSDLYVALFTFIAAVAGLIGIVGIASVFVIWAKPDWFNQTEPVPWWFLVLGLGFYGAALALAFFSGRLARRRAG